MHVCVWCVSKNEKEGKGNCFSKLKSSRRREGWWSSAFLIHFNMYNYADMSSLPNTFHTSIFLLSLSLPFFTKTSILLVEHRQLYSRILLITNSFQRVHLNAETFGMGQCTVRIYPTPIQPPCISVTTNASPQTANHRLIQHPTPQHGYYLPSQWLLWCQENHRRYHAEG